MSVNLRLDGAQPGEAFTFTFTLLLGHFELAFALLGDSRVFIDILNVLQALVRDLGAWDGRLD